MRFPLCAFLIASVSAAPTQAAFYNVTYSGTVTAGYDQTGLLVQPGGDPSGLKWVAKFTIDDANLNAFYLDFARYHEASGGVDYEAQSPITTLLTIGEFSTTMSGIQSAYTYKLINFGAASELSSEVTDSISEAGYSYLNQLNIVLTSETDPLIFGSSPDYRTPADFDVAASTCCGARFTYIRSGLGFNDFANASLRVEHVNIAAAGVVPEPASWALIIGGLCTVGASLRRQRALALRICNSQRF